MHDSPKQIPVYRMHQPALCSPCLLGEPCVVCRLHVPCRTSKALIDCAVAGYNHFDGDIRKACSTNPSDAAFNPSTFYIPQTRDAQQAIEKARQAQTACVEAFAAYATAKVGKDSTVSLADKEAAVTSSLAQLPALLNAIRALIGKPAAAGTAPPPPAVGRSVLRLRTALASLQPVAAPLRSPDYPITRSPDSSEVSHGQ
jgi:hypothetical protein